MKFKALGLCALSILATVVACGGTTDPAAESPEDDSSDEALSSSAAFLKGAWTAEGGLWQGIDFRPNGTYFRDQTRILNGFLINGTPHDRFEGKFLVHTRLKTLTLRYTSEGKSYSQTFNYDYTPARVLNGMPINGGTLPRTEATITLTQSPAPGSRIAFPTITLTKADSWCSTDADCSTEEKDGAWSPAAPAPYQCQANACK